MKKLVLIISIIIVAVSVNAQMPGAITIDPPDATAYDELTLTFDPAEACFESESLSGLPSIAMHSGVTLSSGIQWLYIIDFNSTGANGQPTSLLPTGDGRFSITYTPADYYGFSGENVTQICAVFNNGTDWTQDGRDFESDYTTCMDFFIPINFASGNVIHVPADYPTIQQGINAANFGDTVLVAPGTYPESITLTEGVLLVGSGHESTIIDGQGIGNANGSVVAGAQNSLITQFTICNANTNPMNNLGAGVDAGFTFCTIKQNLITNCRIGIRTQASIVAERNIIINNPGLAGIACSSTGNPLLINNTIVNCSRGIQYGMYSIPEVVNNIITDNFRGIINFGSNNIPCSYNNVYGNGENYEGLPDVTGLVGNISQDPQFVDPGINDFHLQAISPCIDAGDPASPPDPDFTICDMGALYYDQITIINIPEDYPTIQAGINAATEGDIVLVEQGTYVENIDFIGKSITVTSRYLETQDTSFISQTIIDGNQSGTVVKFVSDEDAAAVLCGFTIKNGSSDADGGGIYCESSGPTIESCHIMQNTSVDGGGISCQYGAGPSLSDCIIKLNTATLDGGGLYHEGSCLTTISNCIFDENWAGDEGGGIYYEHDCISTISGCKIINNEATNYGGGICCYDSYIIVEGGVFDNNLSLGRGGGMNANNSSLMINDTEFHGNDGSVHGGAFYYFSNPLFAGNFEIYFSDCTFNNNTTGGSTAGVFIVQDESDESTIDVKIDNCSFISNYGDHRSGVFIGGEDVSFNVSNCIFNYNMANTYVAGLSLDYHCQGSLVNCLFFSNDAALGGENWNSGGVSVWGGADVDIANCTFVENTAAYGAGLTVSGGGIARSINCIYRGNTNNQIALATSSEQGGILNVEYSNLQYGIDSVNVSALSTLYWGEGNIDCDPLFSGTGYHPFSLQDGSACINSGIQDTSGLYLPAIDLAGNVRVFGGRIEMGAYENQNIGVGTGNVASQSSMEVKIFPNPGSEMVHLHYQTYNTRILKSEMFTSNGVLVKVIYDGICHTGNHSLDVDVSDLPAGLYFIRMESGGDVITKKIVLMH